jgi:Chitinase
MLNKNIKIILLIIFSFQVFLSAQKKEIVAYYEGGSAVYRSYFVKNLKSSGSADKITVLNYAFALPGQDSSGNIVLFFDHYIDYQQAYSPDMSIDGIADDSTRLLRGQFNQLKKLKAKYPKLKILLSIGGWGGCTFYSDAALTPESREIFVHDCINKFIYGNLPLDKNAGGKSVAAGIFDGFDIDWEFPVSGGPKGTHYNKNDKENFTELLKLFRKKMDAINPKLLLTAAVAADKPNLDNYDIKNAGQYLNWFNVMTYDYHGFLNNATAHHTNLLSSSVDTTENGAKNSFDKSVKYFKDSLGVSSRKIIPGAAFYGKSWMNVDSTNGGLYQPATFSPDGGYGFYSKLSTLESNGYKYYWDSLAMAPWLYNQEKKIFWTFEDPKSIALKSRYVDAYNLGGLMFWELSGDDSAGTLLNTIYNRNMPDMKVNKNRNGTKVLTTRIIKPLRRDSILAGSNLIISTGEADKSSTIKKVEFYGDGVSLGYDTKAPFNWVWFNVPEGEHKIKVIATDYEGDTTISKEVELHMKGSQ